MKLNLTTEAASRRPQASRPANGGGRFRERGIALVLTLILLSVITFMAITFLAVSHREKDSVTTVTDTATARLAADAALAHAEAQAIANLLATTNPYAFNLLVSTNYLLTNNAVTDLTNLIYFARVPVVVTNRLKGINEDRFYLDLNRNGNFDSNGIVAEVLNDGLTNGVFSFHVGDPEWIGVLERPDQPHGPNNPFIARYAFIALPADQTLDLNYIHNQVKMTANNPQPVETQDGYFRNQGVGTWELNLAAFLTDLNTNQWDPAANSYLYNPNTANSSQGAGFEDALSLLRHRYNNNYFSQATVASLFGAVGQNVFNFDNVDGYGDGPWQTNFASVDESLFANRDNPAAPWAGADNTNRFFTMQELFDTSKSSANFANRLASAGTNVATYDRYTYYRMLAQLGTDSSPAGAGKINLNYDNIHLGSNGVLNASGTSSVTNFVPWTPLGFFTNAADRMLRAYSQRWVDRDAANYGSNYVATFNVTNAFGLTNIPVLVSNRFVYTPAVQRVLQLAANIYDATTTNRFPSVFRPLFSRDQNGLGTNVFISGYTNVISVADYNDWQLALPVDVNALSATNIAVLNLPINVYGVPWIIGAKKGLPNFNEFSEENVVKITRKLRVMRNQTNTPSSYKNTSYITNQLYIFSITNSIGFEFWNSYTNTYFPTSSRMTVVARDNLSMQLTNAALMMSTNVLLAYTNDLITFWPGWTNGVTPALSFKSMAWAFGFLPDSAYQFGSATFIPASDSAWETNLSPIILPQFGLSTTNRLQMFILDGTNIIDYVHQSGPISSRDLNAELTNPDRNDANGLWRTNLEGVANQLNLSSGRMSPNQVPDEDGGAWVPAVGVPGQNTVPRMQAYFQGLFSPKNIGHAPEFTPYAAADVTNLTQNVFVQAPYTPTRIMVEFVSRQANDPLIHYLASDLYYSGTSKGNGQLETGVTNVDNILDLPSYPPNLSYVNERYQPWGKMHQYLDTDSPYNSSLKDPLVWQSDYWDFPTNKYPTIGWLGRVHRGTPWQTVYLKATSVISTYGVSTWANWTGNSDAFDLTNSAPIQDRLIFDLFTTGFNDNATRGTLSVNQDGLAAWSALFSGMVVPPSSATNAHGVIAPAGIYDSTLALTNQPPVVQLWQGINDMRRGFTNFDGLAGTFEHVGDVLSASVLTEKSPFINLANTNYNGDEMYEWLPQQAMSLLSCPTAPRYVIYCYGQALKPAANGVYTRSALLPFGTVTNYQVVSEIATRAVVRIEVTATNITGTNVLLNPRAVIESFNPLPPD